jgi:hypothetical protein
VSNIVVTIEGELILENGSIVDNPGAIQVKGNYTDQGAIILHNPPVKVGAFALLALALDQVGPSISARMATSGEFEISWKAAPGGSFQIETSADLIGWTRSPAAVEEMASGQYRVRFNADMSYSFFRLVTD